jgi:hypothetical protein
MMDSIQEHPDVPRSKSTKVSLTASFAPSSDTIICGRGKAAYTAQGNRRLKIIVTQYFQQYSESRKRIDKSAIVSRVVNMVKQVAAPEVAFVKFEQGQWWQVEDGVAHEKVGRLFRDCPLQAQFRPHAKFILASARGRNAVRGNLHSIALDQSWGHENKANTFSYNKSMSNNFEDCDTMGLEDLTAGLPDDISGIFSDVDE